MNIKKIHDLMSMPGPSKKETEIACKEINKFLNTFYFKEQQEMPEYSALIVYLTVAEFFLERNGEHKKLSKRFLKTRCALLKKYENDN